MGIIELLERVGENAVKVQVLANDMVNISTNKAGTETKVTFATDPECITANDVGHNRLPYVGLVVWIPSDLAEKARLDSKAATQEEGQ